MSHTGSAKNDTNVLNSPFVSMHEELIFTKICNTSMLTNHIDKIKCIIAYKTLDHVLIHVNKTILEYTGYKNKKDIIGKKDSDLVWQDYASIYHKQEEDSLNGHIYSALHPGRDINGRDFLFFNRKYPWKNEKNEVIGIICHAVEVDNPNLIELGSFLKKTAVNNPLGVHFINKNHQDFGLTQRESECLFYLVRGKSSKCLGKILGISYRTAEKHVDSIKKKLNCQNKYDLIDMAISIGFIDIIPNTLFLQKLRK